MGRALLKRCEILTDDIVGAAFACHDPRSASFIEGKHAIAELDFSPHRQERNEDGEEDEKAGPDARGTGVHTPGNAGIPVADLNLAGVICGFSMPRRGEGGEERARELVRAYQTHTEMIKFYCSET